MGGKIGLANATKHWRGKRVGGVEGVAWNDDVGEGMLWDTCEDHVTVVWLTVYEEEISASNVL